jgi:hypothetical protein
MIDHSLAEAPKHYCKQPDILVIEDDGQGGEDWFPTLTIVHPTGTRFICDDCDQVWVSTWIPGYVTGNTAVMPTYEWTEETRKQRRQRLGLKWWQREVKR